MEWGRRPMMIVQMDKGKFPFRQKTRSKLSSLLKDRIPSTYVRITPYLCPHHVLTYCVISNQNQNQVVSCSAIRDIDNWLSKVAYLPSANLWIVIKTNVRRPEPEVTRRIERSWDIIKTSPARKCVSDAASWFLRWNYDSFRWFDPLLLSHQILPQSL
jgi:hypothetical protein